MNSTKNRVRKPLRRASLDRCADICERLCCCDLQFITAGEDKLITQLETDSSRQTLIGVTFSKTFSVTAYQIRLGERANNTDKMRDKIIKDFQELNFFFSVVIFYTEIPAMV